MKLKRLLLMALLALPLMGLFLLPEPTQADTDFAAKNHPEYWEGKGYGECDKYDNVNAKTFTVPAPPSGKQYTLAVVKAGSEQSTTEPHETDTSVKEGDVLRHSSGKDISHVTLCYKAASTNGGNGGNGGSGGGSTNGDVLGTSTTAQVNVPKGRVVAGTGEATTTNAVAAIGLSGSLLVFLFGVRRLYGEAV